MVSALFAVKHSRKQMYEIAEVRKRLPSFNCGAAFCVVGFYLERYSFTSRISWGISIPFASKVRQSVSIRFF